MVSLGGSHNDSNPEDDLQTSSPKNDGNNSNSRVTLSNSTNPSSSRSNLNRRDTKITGRQDNRRRNPIVPKAMNCNTEMIYLATFNFIFILLPKLHLSPNLIQYTDFCHLTNNLKFLNVCKDATSWILKPSLIQRTNKVDAEFGRVNVPHVEDIEMLDSCRIRSVNHTLPWRLWWSSKYV